jgi:dATP pyrophosphohydrolase
MTDQHSPGSRAASGYRPDPAGAGSRIRADIVEVHVVRRAGEGGRWEVLQLQRARRPLEGTWQPVMGHMEPGETAVWAAVRELREEVGLDVREAGGPSVGVWALEQVHPFYVAAIDSVVLSPRLVVQVAGTWAPRLNAEHRAFRWVCAEEALRTGGQGCVWPGQRAAVREIMDLLREENPSRDLQRVGRELMG